MLISNSELDIRAAELVVQVQQLKEKANEYKILYIEHIKYKEKIDELIEKGVINEHGEEVIKF